MGVVKEVKDEKRRAEKYRLPQVQLWEMEMKILIIDGDSGQVLLQDDVIRRKWNPGKRLPPQFNFNGMLAKMTDKLGTCASPRKVIQERYILLK